MHFYSILPYLDKSDKLDTYLDDTYVKSTPLYNRKTNKSYIPMLTVLSEKERKLISDYNNNVLTQEEITKKINENRIEMESNPDNIRVELAPPYTMKKTEIKDTEEKEMNPILEKLNIKNIVESLSPYELMKFTHSLRGNLSGDAAKQYELKSNATNMINCNPASKPDHHELSCFSEEFILHIRDHFNKRVDNNQQIHEDDITKIIPLLYYLLEADTEDKFINILPASLHEEYNSQYFAPTFEYAQSDDKSDQEYLIEHRIQYTQKYVEILRQYEDKYPDFATLYISSPSDHDYYMIDVNKKYHDMILLLENPKLPSYQQEIRILQIFFEMELINKIGIYYVHNEHAQSIFIDKKEKILYFYNSHGYPTTRELGDRNEGLIRLINFITKDDYKIMYGGPHQNTAPKCAVFAMDMIISLLDPKKTKKEKKDYFYTPEDRDSIMYQLDYIYSNTFDNKKIH